MKVAVLGYGVVGVGVYEMLRKSKGLEAGPVLVRPGKVNEDFKCSSLDDILSDKSVDCVAEVMGGIEPAYSYACRALKSGRHFVSSNKALVAAHGIELTELARENNVKFLFSAACGGAVPFLHNISLAVQTDKILSLGGILNGTTNFMLDNMQRNGLDYSEALKLAQSLGYAEADPSADVSGLDALRKIMLACAAAFDSLPVHGLCCEGIEGIQAEDIDFIKSRNLCCRLMAKGGRTEKGIYAYVEPVLFPLSAAECSVHDNYNMASYTGLNSGRIVFMGQGAGRFPTASAVLRDISCIAEGSENMFRASCMECSADNGSCKHRYMVRCSSDISRKLKIAEKSEVGKYTYAVTDSMSVADMHRSAAEIRMKGKEIIFAAIED